MKKTIHPREREEKLTSVSLSVLSPQVSQMSVSVYAGTADSI
jgi:hypothetical protein